LLVLPKNADKRKDEEKFYLETVSGSGFGLTIWGLRWNFRDAA
jgi:hypothetical protein